MTSTTKTPVGLCVAAALKTTIVEIIPTKCRYNTCSAAIVFSFTEPEVVLGSRSDRLTVYNRGFDSVLKVCGGPI